MKLTLCFSLFFFLLANTNSSAAAVKKSMQSMAKNLESLFPYMKRSKKYSKNDRVKIAQTLGAMRSQLTQNKSHFKNSSVPYTVSYEVLKGHFREAESFFKSRRNINDSYAYTLLRAIPLACSRCHVSDEKSSGIFGNSLRDKFESDFEFAEFQFTTRNYSKALRYYKVAIDGGELSGTDLLTAFKRTIFIFLAQKNNLSRALAMLQKYLGSKRPSPFIKETLVDWSSGLKKLSNSKNHNTLDENWDHFQTYISSHLGKFDDGDDVFRLEGADEIFLINLMANLGRYLNGTPKQENMAEAIYWYALSDRVLNYNFYFSHSDLYLKMCVKKFSKQAYARKCFKEYESQVISSFTGSRGTDIPDEVKRELRELRKFIFVPRSLKGQKVRREYVPSL